MRLSDRDIAQALASAEIRLWPELKEGQLRPTGIRLHLARTILIPDPDYVPIDLGGADQPAFTAIDIGPSGWVLPRGGFVLAASTEHFIVGPGLVAHIDGRSTLARLGLMVHCGSTTFDNVHESRRSVTLELANLGARDLVLREGIGIGLLSFSRLSSPITQNAQDQYDGQSDPVAPALRYLDRGENE